VGTVSTGNKPKHLALRLALLQVQMRWEKEFKQLDADHPILSALRRATGDAYIEFMLDAANTDCEQGSDQLADKFLELGRWAYPPSTAAELKELSQDLSTATVRKCGIPELDFNPQFSLLKRLAERRKGRPVSRRLDAIRALELKQADPKRWTWPELAQKFCSCGEKKHTATCSERLRREVGHLKRLLRKHSIPQPTPGNKSRQ
jgi:hypothetical protein